MMSVLGRQTGQGTVEFLVIFVLFLALLAGLFEMARVLRAKHTLNTATFLAARAGIVNNARLAPMNAELANDMASLFTYGNAGSGVNTGLSRARNFAAALRVAGGGVQIVSPTRTVFQELNKKQYVPNADDTALQEIDAIPNDNLRARSHTAVGVSVDGESHRINLQDANLLKVRTLWCQRLVVPVLAHVVFDIVNASPFKTARQGVCNTVSKASGGSGVPSGYYIAITSSATLRMQTPVVENDLP